MILRLHDTVPAGDGEEAVEAEELPRARLGAWMALTDRAARHFRDRVAYSSASWTAVCEIVHEMKSILKMRLSSASWIHVRDRECAHWSEKTAECALMRYERSL
jgi:hypothetical protein